MTATRRHERIYQLFLEASELSGAQRAACLEQACGTDDGLRLEVEVLLELDHEVDGLAFYGGAHLGEVPQPERIGPYRILDVLGHGGMAVVYRARQENPERDVALKVIRPWLVTDETLRRFELEVSVLARLQHPGVARILEASTAEIAGTRLPYFAMELVRGRSLHTYAKEEQLDVAARVQLLVRVCEAVSHAHQRGVIHRDLKPDNVLVDAAGQPRVLDFGISKVTAADGRAATIHTGPGHLLGTIDYMSPEQAGGEADEVDTRSDVYALGVILFELLADELPYPIRDKSVYSAMKLIREQRPCPLGSIRRELGGDIATIVSKALEKDRDERYPSAAELARDLLHFLSSEPISARRHSPLYVLRRWAARNRVLAGTIAGALAVLVTVSAVFLWRLRLVVADFTRVSDLVLLEELDNEAREDLWPERPELEPRLRDWLGRAEMLAQRLPFHQDSLAKLRSRAQPAEALPDERGSSPAPIELETLRARRRLLIEEGPHLLDEDEIAIELSAVDEALTSLEEARMQQRRWLFPDPSDRFLHDNLTSLVQGLERFANDPDGTTARIRQRLDAVRSMEQRTLEEPREQWLAAQRAIEVHPAYGGLRLRPQLGLVPVGPDPESGLWEFVHPRSGETERGVPARDPESGRFAISADSGVIFVLLPGGVNTVGAQDEQRDEPYHDPEAAGRSGPVRRVAFEPFFLSKYELTQAQWLRLAGDNPSYYPPNPQVPEQREQLLAKPVENVTWERAHEVLGHYDLRLPSGVEWEVACRAGTQTRWSTGDDVASLQGYANVADASARTKAPWRPFDPELDDEMYIHAAVGRYRPNGLGLHDMHGNVGEWCSASLARHIHQRVYRGGSHALRSIFASSAWRDWRSSDWASPEVGVRAARSIEP